MLKSIEEKVFLLNNQKISEFSCSELVTVQKEGFY
jgi:hypothetical protein